MPVLEAGWVASVTGGRVVGSPSSTAAGIWSDSRAMPDRFAFAAIRAGHDRISEVVEAGAPFVIAERCGSEDALNAVVVPDVSRALAEIAAAVRKRDRTPTVGITGSTGKTLTKDLLAAALRSSFRVHASPASFNNELGVPLTILSAPNDTEVLVLELAARGPGQIAELAVIARPDVGVVTGIGWTHMEVFQTREIIASTKAELLESLKPGGLAIVWTGDDYLDVLAGATAAPIFTVGPGGQVRASATTLDELGRPRVTVEFADGRVAHLTVPLAGRALARNAMLALAAAVHLGADMQAAAEQIGHAPTSAWRMNVIKLNGRTIINDAYNANPTSVASALRTVREMSGANPAVAILGQMAELGSSAALEHRRMGRLASGLGFASVAAVGNEAAEIAVGATDRGVLLESVEQAARFIASTPEGSFVLLKGSRVAGLEQIPALLGDGRVTA